MRTLLAAALAAVAVSSSGCIGTIRDTTTARSATEMLLVSTAAERAVKRYDPSELEGKRVYIDDSFFESTDKSYVLSSLRDHLASNDVTIVGSKDPASPDNPGGAEVVMEIRNGSLAIWDGDFVLGIPQLPVSAQGFPPVMLPPLYLFRRYSQQGYAKFQLWLYDAATTAFLSHSGDLWGHAFYNTWWVFGIGPFDGSNDIFPEIDFSQFVPGGSDEDGEDGEGEGNGD